MTSIALVFPHTRLAPALAPLTLIFRPALLRPLADASGCSLPDYPCQAIDPPPLGEHLPRFMSLVADITAKGAAEGMSRLLLEAKGRGKEDEDETSRRLAAKIMTAHSGHTNDGATASGMAASGVTANGGARPDDLLWDERLLLTLAEFSDDEEAGLNEKWQQLDGRYRQILAGLHGLPDQAADDDEPISPPAAVLPAAVPPSTQTMAGGYPRTPRLTARLKAWSRLYCLSDAKPIAVWACLEEVADELFEMRTAGSGLVSGQTRVELGEIVLPSCLNLPEQTDGNKGDSHDLVGQDRAGLAEMAGRLATLLGQEKPRPDDFKEFSAAWQQKLDQCFPKASQETSHAGASRGRLRFYDLGDLPAGKVSGCQGELAASGRFLAVWRPGI